MSFMVGPFQEMRIVCSYNRNPKVPADLAKRLITNVLRLDSMIVQLQIEIIFPENIYELARGPLCALQVSGQDRNVDFALETGAHADQAPGMPGQ